MSIFVNILLLIVGLILLVKGSDFFVKTASSIAQKLGVSELIIGLTLVAIGTSIPELFSSIFASLKQEGDIVIGNVMGSNIANIGLIVGMAATIAVITTKEEMLRRDGYIMLLAAFLCYIFIFDGLISRIEAIPFLLLYIAYLVFLVETKQGREGKYHFKEFLKYFLKFGYLKAMSQRIKSSPNRKTGGEGSGEPEKRLGRDLILLAASGVAIVGGANYLIDGAVFVAELFAVPKTIIGISLVAVGTSLPEVAVSLTASRRGYGNIAIGNIIGSNIANIFLILGVSSLIFPLPIGESTIRYTGPFMIVMTILLLVFIKTQWEVRRYEGIGLLLLYIGFMIFIFFNSLH
jgi:cation:H+ antiporter